MWSCAASLLACTPASPPEPPQHETPYAGAPASVLVLDEAAPRLDLVGQGSLFRGRGWDRVEYDQRMELAFSWALRRNARLYYPGRGRGEVDLVLHGYPVKATAPEEGPQTLTLRVDGLVVDRREMPFKWQTIRVPLPAHADDFGLHEIELEFGRHTRPCNPAKVARDCRPVAMTLARAAVVPRDVEDAMGLAYGARFEDGGRRIWLPRGGAIGLPVPPNTRSRLRLRIPDADQCPGCEFTAAWVPRDEDAETTAVSLHAPSDTASPIIASSRGASGWTDLQVTNATREVGTLRLQLGGDPSSGTEAAIDLPEAFLFSRALGEPEERAPDAIVYLIDTLRADVLSPYGGEAETSPEIAAFAAESVVYDAVSSPSAWTLPSVASILSGLYPSDHLADRGRAVNVFLTGEGVSLSEAFTDLGYRTVAISQSEVVGPTFGFDRGFDRFLLNRYLLDDDLGSPQARRILLTWLASEASWQEPFFLYFHTVEPHEPYAPTEHGRRFARGLPTTLPESAFSGHYFAEHDLAGDAAALARLNALYRGEVSDADREFGEFVALLDYLGRYDDSILALTSDHGEEFADHGGFDHGRTLFEEMIAVPLIVRFPRAAHGGGRSGERVSTLDIGPTMLTVAGASQAVPTSMAGRVLPPLSDAMPGRVVYTEIHPVPGPISALIDFQGAVQGDFKCIHSPNGFDQWREPIPAWQAYAIDVDPTERAAQPPDRDVAARCQELIAPLIARRVARAANETSADGTMDEDALERLRALGYLR